MNARTTDNILDRLIAEAQADDYALSGDPGGRKVGLLSVVVLALIGLLLIVAFQQRQDVLPAAQERRLALVERIESAGEQVDEAEAKAAQLRLSVSQLQQLATSGLGDDFADQARALEVATGFVGLSGPGAVLTMSDGGAPLPKGVTPEEARVLDIDMQTAVNGLWQAGARAIAINDIRLTSLTAIRTAGEAILVDYRPLVPPYRIHAIGDEDLAERFDQTPAAGELEQLANDYGIESEVQAEPEVTVPASTANLPNRAEVVKGGGR